MPSPRSYCRLLTVNCRLFQLIPAPTKGVGAHKEHSRPGENLRARDENQKGRD